MTQSLDALIAQAAGDHPQLSGALFLVQNNMPEQALRDFFNHVPECGALLWRRFIDFKAERPNMGFDHFIASVVTQAK